MTSPGVGKLIWCGLSPAPQATNEVVGRVPKATQTEMLAAVDSCSRAFQSWSETSILSRQQIFLRYQQLIKDNIVRKCLLFHPSPACFHFFLRLHFGESVFVDILN